MLAAALASSSPREPIRAGGEAANTCLALACRMPDDTRIDRWLCAVRLVKTRPMATKLCEGGHVRINGNPAKASTKVRAGDVVHALIAERERIVEVVRPIETRVGAPVAVTCYVDNSPPPVVREIAPGIKAVRGQGRPSKHLRRELERIRRAGAG